MAWGSARLGLLAAIGWLLVAAGCTQTSHVDADVTTTALAQTKKAVAVMRIGAASPECINVAVLLGVREGDGYRRHQALTVANVRSITDPAVAEVELDPGEYHVLAYKCAKAKTTVTLGDGAGGQLYRTSYASFAVQAGEVVNVGYLHVGASRVGRSSFGRPVDVEIDVTDWPLAELDRFKTKRPQIFAQMTTRLMQVTSRDAAEPGKQDCERLKALKAEGKVQQLPATCQAEPAARRTPAAVAKTSGSL
jgi:hypothetical protein